MPVSGLVVVLNSDSPLRDSAIAAISQDSRIDVGVVKSNQMAIVVDTQSSDEDKELWQWLNELPGIEMVEVAMVGFE